MLLLLFFLCNVGPPFLCVVPNGNQIISAVISEMSFPFLLGWKHSILIMWKVDPDLISGFGVVTVGCARGNV